MFLVSYLYTISGSILQVYSLQSKESGHIMAYDPIYKCGRSPLIDGVEARRIVSGKDVAPPHANPWMVTVSAHKYQDSAKQHSSYGCGGTLISRKHVLSACHCARKCNEENIFNLS